jgi:Spy/CpxP family protein refolding chaperone
MTELMGALARESASDRKELREFATNAQADTAEIRRLLSELEKKISANPTANGGRAEAPRRWLFGGGSS